MPLKTGYRVWVDGKIMAEGLTLQQAVAMRNVDPYTRRIEWTS